MSEFVLKDVDIAAKPVALVLNFMQIFLQFLSYCILKYFNTDIIFISPMKLSESIN